MPGLDSRHAPVMMQVITWALLGWFASTARAEVDGAVAASHQLPVIIERIEDQGRRIERLEALDVKLDRLAENMAGVMVELKRK